MSKNAQKRNIFSLKINKGAEILKTSKTILNKVVPLF